MIKLSHIHPFPARMAPEIVFKELGLIPMGATILDPMAGSGTVLRAASELGYSAVGFDLDPLAVLMSRVWTTPINPDRLLSEAREIIGAATNQRLPAKLPWVDSCEETRKYLDFWFEPKQSNCLRNIAAQLHRRRGRYADALRIALSRIIVTKEKGASIARDTSHSRPHRVFFGNDYDVYAGFLMSCKRLGDRILSDKLIGNVNVNRGDSRKLSAVVAESIDVVITSPPYLNAIDYLRGHRLALVWLGYTIPQLRKIRGRNIGAEAQQSQRKTTESFHSLLYASQQQASLSEQQKNMIRGYSADVFEYFTELKRVLRPSGKVLVVVGDSCLKGVDISNSDINVTAARAAGLTLTRVSQRVLPSAHRYLPPPSTRGGKNLAGRMRTESLLTFQELGGGPQHTHIRGIERQIP